MQRIPFFGTLMETDEDIRSLKYEVKKTKADVPASRAKPRQPATTRTREDTEGSS